MAGQRQKHPNALQNKRGGRYRPLKLLPPGQRAIPRCPKGVGAQARAYWKQLWSSPVAEAWGDIDAIPLTRYIVYVDSWLEVKGELDQEGVVAEGRRSGEEVLSPLARYWLKLEAVLRPLEAAFGLDALSRLRLGVSVAPKYDPVSSLKAPAVAEYKKRRTPSAGQERSWRPRLMLKSPCYSRRFFSTVPAIEKDDHPAIQRR